MDFRLNPHLDLEALAHEFQAGGRIQIADIWEAATAEGLARWLENETAWSLVYNQGDKVVELEPRELKRMIERRKRRLIDDMHRLAVREFAFCYSAYPISRRVEAAPEPDNPLHQYLEFINSDEMLGFMRRLSGIEEIFRSDAQATCYSAGHFLSVHDDAANYQPRRLAYVFGFTKGWQPDWGGYLQFFDQAGDIKAGLLPKFNVFNVFAVPRYHSVSPVSPAAPAARYSITGWFLDGPDPGPAEGDSS